MMNPAMSVGVVRFFPPRSLLMMVLLWLCSKPVNDDDNDDCDKHEAVVVMVCKAGVQSLVKC